MPKAHARLTTHQRKRTGIVTETTLLLPTSTAAPITDCGFYRPLKHMILNDHTPSDILQRHTVRTYIGIGGNLGEARQTVQTALRWLQDLPDTDWVKASSLYRSAPWQADGPDYINAVAVLDTRLTAPHLLQALQALEQRAGRRRPYWNAPRTLDLDVLFYGNASIQSPQLTVPHPRCWQRAFVLRPLAEIDPSQVSADALALVADQRVDRLVD